MGKTNNIAVLLFAQSANCDRKALKISHGAKIVQKLSEHALQKAISSKLSFYHIDENQQSGDTFGERFTASIEAVFQKGYEHVITIGNDTPQLQTSHILKAAKNLQLGKSVIGPSTDGGFYLLGISRNRFNPNSFKALPWKERSLFRSTLNYFTGQEIELLPRLDDIDDEADLLRLLRKSVKTNLELFRFLKSIFQDRIAYATYIILPKDLDAFQTPLNKGSPQLI